MSEFPGSQPSVEQFSARPGAMAPGLQGSSGNFSSRMPPPVNFPPFQGFPNQNMPFRNNFPVAPMQSANQTLPKPPIFDKDGQVWLEACTGEGKIYYFNAKTRETRWDKPCVDSSSTDKKDEDSTAQEGDKSEEKQQTDDKAKVDKREEGSETSETDGPKKNNNDSTESPALDETNKSNPDPSQQLPLQQSAFPPGMTQGMPPPFGMVRPGMMPPGFPAFAPRALGAGMSAQLPPFPGFGLPPPDFVPKTIGDWTEHRLPDGRLYYYDNKSKESKWEKPAVFQEIKKQALDKSDKPLSVQFERKMAAEKKVENEQKPVNSKQKPVASRPITGTGWHLVWTGDGKVFFFNPTSKTSIWERPKPLENNILIDEILKQGPNPKKEEIRVADVEMKKVETNKENESNKRSEKEVLEIEPIQKKKKVQQTEEDLNGLHFLPIVDTQMKKEEEKEGNKEDKVSHLKIAKEADVKKAIIPLEERMIMFTSLLREKEVSAFSTWEKELHKILFDPRYLLLMMKERKQCYEKYVKIRAVEERKERIQKLKEKKDEFKKLLDEVISSSRTSFSDFAGKNSKDARYKGIEKMKEREQLFNEFMTDFRKHEKERLKIREEKLRKNFFELLSELNNITEASEWKKVKSSVQTDRRYELVGSSSKREQFFYDYLKQLNNQENEERESENDVKENIEKDSNGNDRVPSPEPAEDAELDKSERIEASLRKREEEVRAQKEVFEKDRQKERGLHLHEKAVQHFRALLADMVKDTQFSWKETRRSLRKDPRWTALDVLDKAEKEALFNQHITDIKDKRKKSFRKLLDEADVPLDGHWREVRRQIKDDPRYAKFGTSELREEEFESYLREKVTSARSDFRELLRETKLITYKSKELMRDSNHLKDITEILKKDKRYHVMASLSHERERLLKSHLDELHKRGPPPPPTATNPALRYKKE